MSACSAAIQWRDLMPPITFEALLQAPYRTPDAVTNPFDGLTPDWIWWAKTAPISKGSNKRASANRNAIAIDVRSEEQTVSQQDSRDEVEEVLVCVIHGGCWSAEFDREHLRPLCTFFAEQGLSSVLPEYRRCGEPGAGWPGTFADIVSAVARAKALAMKRGARLVVFGHSAGGHLALWLNARGLGCSADRLGDRETFEFDAVVALAPITDLERYGQGSGSCQVMVEALITSGEVVSPRDISPRFGEAWSKETVIAAALDSIVPADQTQDYASERKGECIVLEGIGHFDALIPGHPACEALAQILSDSVSRGRQPVGARL